MQAEQRVHDARLKVNAACEQALEHGRCGQRLAWADRVPLGAHGALLGDVPALRRHRRDVVPGGHVPNRTQRLCQMPAEGAGGVCGTVMGTAAGIVCAADSASLAGLASAVDLASLAMPQVADSTAAASRTIRPAPPARCSW